MRRDAVAAAATIAPQLDPVAAPPSGALTRRLFLQSAGTFGLNGATVVFNFVTALVFSRLLGPAGYGAYSFALAWAMLLAVPALLGLPQLLVRELATYRVRGDWPRARRLVRRANQAVLASSVAVSLVAAGAFWTLGWPNAPLFEPTLVGLAFVPVLAMVTVRQSVMLGFGRVLLGRAPEALVAPLVTIALALVLARSVAGGLSAGWAMGAFVAAAAATAALGLYVQHRTLPVELGRARPVGDTRVWLSASIPLLLAACVTAVNTQAGAILTGSLAGSHEAGIYGAASRVAGFLPFVLIASIPPLMPAIAELHERGDRVELQRVVDRAARGVFLGSLPLLLGVLVLAHPVLALFGPNFGGAVGPLRMLAVGQLVNIATGLAGVILVMIGDAGRATFAIAIGAGLNLALSVTLIPGHGAGGAAVATSASVAVTNLLMVWMLWHRRRLHPVAIRLRRPPG